MSASDPFDPALRALLDADRPPALPDGFAARVASAAQARRDPLPRLRRSPAQRWRVARRVGLGVVAAGLLSSAAAATGLLQDVGITLPQPVQHFVDSVTETVTGRPPREPVPALAVEEAEPVVAQQIDGPIDNPQELETAFRRIDETRDSRQAVRRERVDGRIDQVLADRRAQGLPVPTPEEEALLRQRIDETRARRDAVAGERREALREDLRERVEQGEAITPRDLVPNGERIGERLTPAQREALRRRLAERRAAQADTDSASETPENRP